MITYRLAKSSDAMSLAKVHIICAKHQNDGFFHKLGVLFIWRYYKILISNKHSVIVLAEDENGFCYGFHSGTLKAEEQLLSMKKNKISLFFSVLPQLILSPNLILEVIKRYKYVSNDKSIKYGVKFGPRAVYWAWHPSYKNGPGSVMIRKMWGNIIYELGYGSFKFEVDLTNVDIKKYVRAFSCILIEELDLPDGRKRVILEQSSKKFRVLTKK